MSKRSVALANLSAPAIVGVGVVGLFGLLFVGHFFGRLSTGYGLAMLLSPLLCWVTEMPPLRHRKPWVVGSLRLVLIAIPLLVVLAAAKRDFDRDMAPLLGKIAAASRSAAGR
jgi:predicted PurR-regulated permease PerM